MLKASDFFIKISEFTLSDGNIILYQKRAFLTFTASNSIEINLCFEMVKKK